MFTSVFKIIYNCHLLNKCLNYFVVLIMVYRIKIKLIILGLKYSIHDKILMYLKKKNTILVIV